MLEEREKKSIASQKQATAAAKAEIEELSQARKAKCDARAKLNKYAIYHFPLATMHNA